MFTLLTVPSVDCNNKTSYGFVYHLCGLSFDRFAFILLIFSFLFGSTIRISRKGWHMLLNFSFHTALTFAVFAGGINRIKYPIICQAVSSLPMIYVPVCGIRNIWCKAHAFMYVV